MAKTQTTLTEAEITEAYEKLNNAATAMIAAINEFKSKYDCDTVGLDEWADSINEVMCDVEADIDNTIEE